jgi:chaperone BCS1
MASVTILSSDDQLSSNIKRWILTKAIFRTRRALTAYSASHAQERNLPVQGIDKTQIIFESHAQIQFFRHNGKWFVYTKEANGIKIWCLGWSPKRIQQLLSEIQDKEQEKEQIRVFTPQCNSSWSDNWCWGQRSKSARRTLESVCLDSELMNFLVDDLSDYLSPDSAAWYGARGIPYRRGYLLYGKPDCGKTSFAISVAGQFKLSVYMVSLLDSQLTDDGLLELFQSLGPGDLILLEDIDCAGLGREFQPPIQEDASLGREFQPPIQEDASLGREFQPPIQEDAGHDQESQWIIQENDGEIAILPGNKKDPKKRPQVTLSGLLNAIDGASAPQGHILIMTTNHPELLDPALIRPGRVDVHVKFEYATKKQIQDLFIKMYTPHSRDKPARFDTSNVPELANLFASIVPADKFTPAEIQQFLLFHRIRPQAAVDGAINFVRQKLPDEFRDPSFALVKPKFSQQTHLLVQNMQDDIAVEGTSESAQEEENTAPWISVTRKRRRNRRFGETAKAALQAEAALHGICPKGPSSGAFLFSA